MAREIVQTAQLQATNASVQFPKDHGTHSTPRIAGQRPAPCQFAKPGETCEKCGIRMFSVCGALQPAHLSELDAMARHIEIPAKATLFEQGARTTHVYSITSGVVRLFRLLSDGRRQIIGFALPGDFLGLSLAANYAFGAEAVEPLQMCQFTKEEMSGFVKKHPEVLERMHELIAHELIIAQDQMVILGRLDAEERVAAFLLNQHERYKRIGRASVTVPLPMLRVDMADYLGLTIETVSRTISKMARNKIILVVPDGVRILDMARLTALIS